MSDNLAIEPRFFEEGDLPSLREWFLSPGMLEHYPMDSEKEVDEMIGYWESFCKLDRKNRKGDQIKCGLTFLLEQDGKKVPVCMGMLLLMPYRKVAHHAQFLIVVDPKHQRKGLGTSMVHNLMHLASSKDYWGLEMLLAEVFEGSGLIPLLKKEGFHVYGEQKGYVLHDKKFKARVLFEIDLLGGSAQ